MKRTYPRPRTAHPEPITPHHQAKFRVVQKLTGWNPNCRNTINRLCPTERHFSRLGADLRWRPDRKSGAEYKECQAHVPLEPYWRSATELSATELSAQSAGQTIHDQQMPTPATQRHFPRLGASPKRRPDRKSGAEYKEYQRSPRRTAMLSTRRPCRTNSARSTDRVEAGPDAAGCARQ